VASAVTDQTERHQAGARRVGWVLTRACGFAAYNQAMRFRCCFIPVLGVLLAAGFASAQPMVVASDKSNGVYQVGETVHWSLEWKGAGEPPATRFTRKSGGFTNVGAGEVIFSNQVGRLDTRFDAPGTMLVEATWLPESRTNRAIGGAVAGAEQIRAAVPPPADFDEFWKGKLAELAKVPPNPRLEEAPGARSGVAYWKITLDNIRGTHIQGQIARPEKGEKLPALLIVQWAGVYPLKKEWVTDRAAAGWLALDIEAHDVPIDRPESFYHDLFAGELKEYWNLGNDDRDRSYFLRMYLSGYQALEYLKTRPDWNGKTLVVMGTSQGGQQTLMLAGLHPADITAALALVPAGCDLRAPEAGRAPGWPGWYFNTAGKDASKVRETSRYFDVANFARHIQCPVLVGVGLRDEVCAPSSVLAAVNEISAPKELVVLPRSGHQDEQGTQGAYSRRCYEVWLPALCRGAVAPVR